MFSDEYVDVEVWVSCGDSVDLIELALAERLVLVEAPDAFQQSLASQHFMQPGDAAGKPVRGVEEGSIRVGHRDRAAEHVGLQLVKLRGGLAVAQQFHRPLRPNRPMP